MSGRRSCLAFVEVREEYVDGSDLRDVSEPTNYDDTHYGRSDTHAMHLVTRFANSQSCRTQPPSSTKWTRAGNADRPLSSRFARRLERGGARKCHRSSGDVAKLMCCSGVPLGAGVFCFVWAIGGSGWLKFVFWGVGGLNVCMGSIMGGVIWSDPDQTWDCSSQWNAS